jgi:hypothetical protein
MKIGGICTALVLAIVVCFGSVPCKAEDVTWYFEGIVTDSPVSHPDGIPIVGQEFAGSVTFDKDAEPASPIEEGDTGARYNAITKFTLEMGDCPDGTNCLSFWDTVGRVYVTNDKPRFDDFMDQYQFWTKEGSLIGPNPLKLGTTDCAPEYLLLEYTKISDNPIVVDKNLALPVDPPNTDDLEDWNLVIVYAWDGNNEYESIRTELTYIGLDPPGLEEYSVHVDIKPGSCTNPVNVKSKGKLSVVILGTSDLGVEEIDTASVRLAGVAPVRSSIEDVLTPQEGCSAVGPDGFNDLVLKFNTQEIVAVLDEVTDGEELILTLAGALNDGTQIEGEDVILIKKKGKKKGKK